MIYTFGAPFDERFESLTGKPGLFTIDAGAITRVRDLSTNEFDGYRHSCTIIDGARQGDVILSAAEENWDEFTRSVEELHAYVKSDPDIARGGGAKLSVTVNRRLANFLALMRLYFDHEEKRVKRSYGADSAEAKRFKHTCGRAYDESFSYRFAYRLRNYALHHGFPVGHISTKAWLDSDDKPHSSLRLCFAVEELLLAEREVWRSLADELRSKAPLLDVFESLNDLPNAVRWVRATNRHWEMQYLRHAGSEIIELLRDGMTASGGPAVGCYLNDGGRLAVELYPSSISSLVALGVDCAE